MDSARFRAALDANPRVREVQLGSTGGSVHDALEAGRLIRARGLRTVLYTHCDSACLLVFLGGVERIAWASPARFGFHQFSVRGATLPLDYRRDGRRVATDRELDLES